jgi:hypothetical protein
MDVLTWMRIRTAHVATSRLPSVVPRRIVRATKAVLPAPRHAVAWIVFLGVVLPAIAYLDSGFIGVSVFVVAEAHLGDCEIDWKLRKVRG